MVLEVKQRLQAELDKLESELRVHLPKEIKRALEFGDLRENSEYQTALRINPRLAAAHLNLGLAFTSMPGHLPDAIGE